MGSLYAERSIGALQICPSYSIILLSRYPLLSSRGNNLFVSSHALLFSRKSPHGMKTRKTPQHMIDTKSLQHMKDTKSPQHMKDTKSPQHMKDTKSPQHIIKRSDKLHNETACDTLADENALICLIGLELKLKSGLEHGRV